MAIETRSPLPEQPEVKTPRKLGVKIFGGWERTTSRDESQRGTTTVSVIQAIKLNGVLRPYSNDTREAAEQRVPLNPDDQIIFVPGMLRRRSRVPNGTASEILARRAPRKA
jgi:hypothetical protein